MLVRLGQIVKKKVVVEAIKQFDFQKAVGSLEGYPNGHKIPSRCVRQLSRDRLVVADNHLGLPAFLYYIRKNQSTQAQFHTKPRNDKLICYVSLRITVPSLLREQKSAVRSVPNRPAGGPGCLGLKQDDTFSSPSCSLTNTVEHKKLKKGRVGKVHFFYNIFGEFSFSTYSQLTTRSQEDKAGNKQPASPPPHPSSPASTINLLTIY